MLWLFHVFVGFRFPSVPLIVWMSKSSRGCQSGEQCGGLNEGRSLPLFLLVSYMPSRLLNIQKFDWTGERLRIRLLA